MVLEVKTRPINAGDTRDVGSFPGSGKSPGGGHGNPTPIFLPGEPHGQRSLAGYSSWNGTKSDTIEATEHAPQLTPKGCLGGTFMDAARTSGCNWHMSFGAKDVTHPAMSINAHNLPDETHGGSGDLTTGEGSMGS